MNPFVVRMKLLSQKMETEEYVKNPHKDSGFDLFIPEYEVNSFGVEKEYAYVFAKNRPKLIDLGIQCAAYEVSLNSALSPKPQPFMIYPRSSIYKTPFRFANNTGIIDSGYRGNLKAAFDNKEKPCSRFTTIYKIIADMYARFKNHLR